MDKAMTKLGDSVQMDEQYFYLLPDGLLHLVNRRELPYCAGQVTEPPIARNHPTYVFRNARDGMEKNMDRRLCNRIGTNEAAKRVEILLFDLSISSFRNFSSNKRCENISAPLNM